MVSDGEHNLRSLLGEYKTLAERTAIVFLIRNCNNFGERLGVVGDKVHDRVEDGIHFGEENGDFKYAVEEVDFGIDFVVYFEDV